MESQKFARHTYRPYFRGVETRTKGEAVGFLEREATPKSAIKLGIRLHVAGLSLSDTASVLAGLGVDRHRTTIHTWMQKAVYSQRPGTVRITSQSMKR